MDPPLLHERRIAELAVLRAAKLTKKVLSSVSEVSKQDSTPVTVADFAAQALIISALRNAFPEDSFVGEEDAAVLRQDEALRERVYQLVSSAQAEGCEDDGGSLLASPASMAEMLDVIDLGGRGQGGRSGRFWVMDPVDGTATFLRGEQYAVSLALIEDGRELVGVLCCPNLKLDGDGRVRESSVDVDGLGVLLTAVWGQGTTIRLPSPSTGLSSSPPRALERLLPPDNLAHLHVIDCLESKSSRHDIVQQLCQSFGAPYPGTDIWSSHVRYAALILGGGDFHLRVPSRADVTSYIWDHAGAQLIYTEMGGKVTDLDGRVIDFGAGRVLKGNRGMVAAKEGIHDKILQEIKELLGERGS